MGLKKNYRLYIYKWSYMGFPIKWPIYIYTCGFLVVGHRCGGSRDRWLYMEVVSVFLSYGGFDAQV